MTTPKIKQMRIRADGTKNKALANELGTLRGGMVAMAELQPIPKRFSVEPDVNRPCMIFTDHQTGRQATVGLYAYRACRGMLTELFA